MNGERGTKIVMKYFWMSDRGAKRIHQELVTTPGDDANRPSQIKIWLQKFRNGSLSCKEVPRPGRPPLTRGPQPSTFLEKYPFSSARVIAQHFFTIAPPIRDIFQRELGMKQLSQCWAPHFLSFVQRAARVEASTEMPPFLQGSEASQFEGIATGDDLGFDTPVRPRKGLQDHEQRLFR
jgi:hypothetical protein